MSFVLASTRYTPTYVFVTVLRLISFRISVFFDRRLWAALATGGTKKKTRQVYLGCCYLEKCEGQKNCCKILISKSTQFRKWHLGWLGSKGVELTWMMKDRSSWTKRVANYSAHRRVEIEPYMRGTKELQAGWVIVLHDCFCILFVLKARADTFRRCHSVQISRHCATFRCNFVPWALRPADISHSLPRQLCGCE